MFDPNFDPYLILEHTKLQVQHQQRSIGQLITGQNQQDALMLDLTEQLKLLLKILNEHKKTIEQQQLELNILYTAVSQLQNR